jgi:hypothetical protein
MATQVRIVLEQGDTTATLDDSPTGAAIRAALPLEGVVSTWGEEIYFIIPVSVAESADARQDMAVGELGYWPVGAAICIFFGPTPVSTGSAPRAYSNVNPFGRIDGDEATIREFFGEARDGQTIRVEAV